MPVSANRITCGLNLLLTYQKHKATLITPVVTIISRRKNEVQKKKTDNLNRSFVKCSPATGNNSICTNVFVLCD